MSARLAIMVGLPRSGKSTYAKALQEAGWTRITPDEFRLALHGQPYYPPAEPLVWAAVELAVRALLRGGHAVVVDATNTTRRRRAGWLKIAEDLGLALEAFVLDTTLDTCHERNLQSRRVIPPEVLDRMAEAFEEVIEEGIALRIITNT